MSAAPIPVETLLAHREWVRSVARAVVRDENAADDVEQETWVAALSTPPRDKSSLRGWFGTVTRSRARRIGRSESRRDAREAASARREATPSAADLAEIADTHRRVVAAVVALDEPYRETILLRYFEGLAIDAVAAASGVPLETTRSRLKRGVAKLRERLAEEFGEDDRPWQMALVPLIGKPRGAGLGAAAGGGIVMAASVKIACGVAALLLVATAWWALPSNGDGSRASSATQPAPEAASAAAQQPSRSASRTRADAAETAAPVAAEAVAREAEHPGRTAEERLKDIIEPLIFDADPPLVALGRIAAESGVPVLVTAEAAAEMTARRQTFSVYLMGPMEGGWPLSGVTKEFGTKFVVERDRVLVVPADGKWDSQKPLIVPPPPPASPRITVIGRVTDAHGVAVAGAEVVRHDSDLPRAVTDIAGRFELRLRRPFGSLQARMDGRVPSRCVEVAGEPDAQVTIDLTLGGAGGSLRVTVTADGAPLAHAGVELGEPHAVEMSRADGTDFRMALDSWTPEDGQVLFRGLRPGRTTVTADCSGYVANTVAANVAAGVVSQVEIALTRLPPLKERVEKARVTVRFESTPVLDAIEQLHESTGICVDVDQSLVERGRTATTSLGADDAPLTDVLAAICRALDGATYEIDDAKQEVLIRPDKR